MRVFRTLARVAVVLNAWGGAQVGAPRTLASQSVSNDAQIYKAYLATMPISQQMDTLYVAERTAVFHAPTSITQGQFSREYEGLPSTLLVPLERASSLARPSQTLNLPYPIRVISSEELKATFAKDPTKGWVEFHHRYPNVRSYFAFSPIVYSADGADALFWAEWYCGSLCAGGEAVWVARDAQGRWQFLRKVLFWIS